MRERGGSRQVSRSSAKGKQTNTGWERKGKEKGAGSRTGLWGSEFGAQTNQQGSQIKEKGERCSCQDSRGSAFGARQTKTDRGD